MEHALAIKTLSKTGWLTQTPPSFRSAILELTEVKEQAAGETLYYQGDPPKGLYGLAHGSLNVFSTLWSNEPRLIHIARPGWWVGEASILSRSMTRIEVTARTPSTILFVSASSVTELARNNPEIWRYLNMLTISHLDDALRLAGSILAPDAKSRLVTTLLRLSHPRTEAEKIVQLPVSQGELAELAGFTRNSVGPVLKDLAASGYITLQRRLIQLNDPERMAKLLEE